MIDLERLPVSIVKKFHTKCMRVYTKLGGQFEINRAIKKLQTILNHRQTIQELLQFNLDQSFKRGWSHIYDPCNLLCR